MAAPVVLVIECRFAWWFFWLYMPLIYFGIALGFEPDWGRFSATMRRAARFRVVKHIEVVA